jgi:hypothetical protein
VNLEEFIKETLRQIMSGVKQAKAIHSGVATHVIGHNDPKILQVKSGAGAFAVDFDVAVSVTDKGESGGKAGIAVFKVLEASGARSKGSEHSTVSRVKFTVPVYFG